MALLPDVPPHLLELKIRILYSDDDIVVFDKPCDLRSVPGHANPPPPEKERRHSGADDANADTSRSHRRTAQEAWVKAIQLVAEDCGQMRANRSQEVSIEEAAVTELLKNLGTTANPCCVPRRLETFVKYCHRNSNRLLPKIHDRANDVGEVEPQTRSTNPSNRHAAPAGNARNPDAKNKQYEPTQKKQKRDKSCNKNTIPPLVRSIAQMSYGKIKQKQLPLMNLPTPTKDSESAIGQLHLLGFGDYEPCVSTATKQRLHVVHRLDCQTSGIMVVARNQAAASFLCQAWREREHPVIQKVYFAHVIRWPPYHEHRMKEGTIDVPLAPSRTERIKWEALPVTEGGKECKTFWKVYEDMDNVSISNDDEAAPSSQPAVKGITLELHPITGRTHQLRLHCAAIGSGIVGDSLYGDSPIEWCGDHTDTNQKQETNSKLTTGIGMPKTLRLHAHKLVIPHPSNGEKLVFESAKAW